MQASPADADIYLNHSHGWQRHAEAAVAAARPPLLPLLAALLGGEPEQLLAQQLVLEQVLREKAETSRLQFLSWQCSRQRACLIKTIPG